MVSLKKAVKIIFNIKQYARERSELRKLISTQNDDIIPTSDCDVYGLIYKQNRVHESNNGNTYGNFSTCDIKETNNV